MDIYNCKHVRVRGNNDFQMDIETFLKNLEKQFKLDIRTLPQWKDLIQNMHVVLSDYNTKVQNAAFRKINIINKLYIQNTRPSPFELTNNLVRTAKLWQDMENKRKKREVISETPSDILYTRKIPSIELVGEVSDIKSTGTHPNTEIIQSDNLLNKNLDADVVDDDGKQNIGPQLPVYICTNQHKILSPLGSQISQLSCKLKETCSESQKEYVENSILNSTNLISYQPDRITITDKMVGCNVVKLFLTNKTTEYLHIQFKNILDSNNFSSFEVKPKNATKLYPGLTACFKFYFKLVKSVGNFSTFLCFRIRRNVLTETPENFLYIPIITNLIEDRCVLVPRSISVPPVYSWQVSIKQGYPKTILHITVKDNFCYNLHVRKRPIITDQVPDDGTISVEAVVSSTESTEQHANEGEQNTFKSPSVKESEEDDIFTSEEVVTKVLEDIVDLSLEPFVFQRTFLRLSPHTQRMTLVYFTKALHIGFHQCLYDLHFYDTETETLVLTTTIRIYAEVLPNPIVINPIILDMSNSEIVHGQCCGSFVITNYNKVYTFDVKIKTTKRMDKIFTITPKETSVVAQSSTPFFVNYCSKSLNTKSDDKAYFVIKIVLKSNIPMFINIPPIFYEMIAPCVAEFKKVYNIVIAE